jgi:cell division protein FtsW (lipid II flippase)
MQKKEDQVSDYINYLEINLKTKLKKVGLNKKYSSNYSYKYQDDNVIYPKMVFFGVIFFLSSIVLVSPDFGSESIFNLIVKPFFPSANFSLELWGTAFILISLLSFIKLIILILRIGLNSDITVEKYSKINDVSKYDEVVLKFSQMAIANNSTIKNYNYKYLKIDEKIKLVNEYNKTLKDRKEITKDIMS